MFYPLSVFESLSLRIWVLKRLIPAIAVSPAAFVCGRRPYGVVCSFEIIYLSLYKLSACRELNRQMCSNAIFLAEPPVAAGILTLSRFHRDCGAPIANPARIRVIFQTGRVGDRRSGGSVRMRPPAGPVACAINPSWHRGLPHRFIRKRGALAAKERREHKSCRRSARTGARRNAEGAEGRGDQPRCP